MTLTLTDLDRSDLAHWAAFGLVYPPACGFEPGGSTPGHEVAPPRYPPGADVRLIWRVEEVFRAAASAAEADAQSAADAARRRQYERDLNAGLPRDRAAEDQAAAQAREPLNFGRCRMRDILALVYGPIRGHAALEAALGRADAEALRWAAEARYAAASAAIPRRARSKPPGSPVARDREEIGKSMGTLVREVKALMRRRGL